MNTSIERELYALQVPENDNDRRPIAGSGVCIFGAPKSASTFVAHAVARLWNAPIVPSVLGNQSERRELVSELDVALVGHHARTLPRWVAPSHVMANFLTLAVCDLYSLPGIVTIRNLPDTILSLRNELLRQWPEVFLPEIERHGISSSFLGAIPVRAIKKFVYADEDMQLQMAIEWTTAWYVRFIDSWVEACRRAPSRFRLYAFENIVRDEVAALGDIVRFFALPIDTSTISQVVAMLKADHAVANIDVGQVGRGLEMLGPHHRKRIKEIASTFDLTPALDAYLVDGVLTKEAFV